MCGRYLLTTPSEALRRMFGFIEHPNLEPLYNIAPTEEAPVLRQRRQPKGERTLKPLRWGLVPSFSKDMTGAARMINARCETLLAKPAFQKAFAKRRCLVPADGFYEWRLEDGVKQPYLISRRDGQPMAFAGLWERWTPPAERGKPGAPYTDTFTIVTTDANDLLQPLHDRMPVVLMPEDFAAWLDPDAEPRHLLKLLTPAPDDALQYRPVSRRVNTAKDKDPAVAEPIQL